MKKLLSLILVLSMMVGMLCIMPTSVAADENVITIASVDDWMEKLNGKEDLGNATINVTAAELDFTGKELSPIIGFTGTFEGNGVVLKKITMSGEGDVGLFCTSSGTYQNVVITESTFSCTKNWIAPLICCTCQNTTVKNVYVSASVWVTVTGSESSSYAGGIIGGCAKSEVAYDVLVTDCVFAGTITAVGKYAGGIVGSGGSSSSGQPHNITVKNSIVLGKTAGKSPSCGFVGYNKYGAVNMENCIYAGGAENDYFPSYPFFRDNKSYTITNCYTTHVNSDDTVYRDADGGVAYTEANSGVVYLNKDNTIAEGADLIEWKRCLMGLDAIEVTGFTRRLGDVMVPNGVASFAPFIYGASYTVTWANDDGTVLATEIYEGGATPEYKGATPTKAEDDTYTYTFKEWSPEVVAVGSNVTYTATFYKTRKNIIIDDETDAPETDATVTEAPATEANTDTTDTTEKKGCGAVLGGGALVLSMMLGSAVVLVKKKKDE